jgi:hypothetical protein
LLPAGLCRMAILANGRFQPVTAIAEGPLPTIAVIHDANQNPRQRGCRYVRCVSLIGKAMFRLLRPARKRGTQPGFPVKPKPDQNSVAAPQLVICLDMVQ